VAVAVAQGYHIPDTPEVQAAKQQFFAAYDVAARAASASSPNYQPQQASYQPQQASYQPQASYAGLDDGQSYPAAAPYVHEEPAYGGDYSTPTYSAPSYSQQAAPSYSAQAAPSYNSAPAGYSGGSPAYDSRKWGGACVNNLGEQVVCREEHKQY
jgi:hypothetical protein